MQFDLPKDKASIIKVIGVGGGGSNAVNHMYRQGIKGVDFVVCNTDQQALDISPVPNKIQLGITLTEGLGAGSIPEVGKNSAVASLEDIRAVLGVNTKIVFITAGMGGGTGTGAAPIIAELAKSMGILTVGIVTMPFSFEGRKREMQAAEGLDNLKKNTDALLVIKNDKLREIYGNLTMKNAFAKADEILTTAAKSIAEIISKTYYINVDFKDIQTVMSDSGVAIMGSASAEGDNRAIKAVQLALESPLLNDNNIEGARHVLLNVVSGTNEITMDEFDDIQRYIQNAAGNSAEVIFGQGEDESLGEEISVTIIATGFKTKKELVESHKPATQVVHTLPPLEKNTVEVVENHVEEVSNNIEPEAKADDISAELDLPVNSDEDDGFRLITRSNEITSENEISFEFEFVNKGPSHMPSPAKQMGEEPSASLPAGLNIGKTVLPTKDDLDEQFERARQRIMRLKSLNNISEAESVPAFVSRGIRLDDVTPSAKNDISRYTLGEDENNRPEIRPNNSFLHDRAD